MSGRVEAYRSPLAQHWYVPSAGRARRLAHLLPGPPEPQRLAAAACGERRRSWEWAGGVEDEVGYCLTCQDASARPSSPTRGAAAHPAPGSYSNVFSRYGVALARSGLSENTRRSYLSRTAAALRWAAAEGLGPTGWTDPTLPGRYRSYLVEQGRAAATVNAHLTAVEDFLRRSGIGQESAARVPVSVDYRYLRPGEELALAGALTGLGRRDRAVVELLRLGLKVGELAALNGNDVARDGDGTVLRVNRGSRHERQVPLPAAVHQLIAPWAKRRPGPLLWERTEQRRLSARRVHGILARLGATAGIDDLKPRVLRATYAASRIVAVAPDDLAVALGVSTDQAERIRQAIHAQTAHQHADALEHAKAAALGAAATVLSNWEDYSAAAARALEPYRPTGSLTSPVGVELRHLALQHEPALTTPASLTRQLQRFAGRHREALTAVYARFGSGAPTVFVAQPEALLMWRAVDRDDVHGVGAADLADLHAIWRHPGGVPIAPPPTDTEEW